MTGVVFFQTALGVKRLELLHELSPRPRSWRIWSTPAMSKAIRKLRTYKPARAPRDRTACASRDQRRRDRRGLRRAS